MGVLGIATIVGIVAISLAIVITYAVYLMLTSQHRPKGINARNYHNYVPDMHWYQQDPDLYDTLFMTFGVVIGMSAGLPQLITNGQASDMSEMETIDPFYILMGPIAIACHLVEIRHTLARFLKNGIPVHAIVAKIIGYMFGIAVFIAWIFQYSIALHHTHRNHALSYSMLSIATVYSIVWLWLVYWFRNVQHYVHLQNETKKNAPKELEPFIQSLTFVNNEDNMYNTIVLKRKDGND